MMEYILIHKDVVNKVAADILNATDEIDSQKPELAKQLLLKAYEELITNQTLVNVCPQS
jgi:hypothetical protein